MEDLDDAGRAWQQVNSELDARRAKRQSPGDWHALGRLVGVARNTANNWRARGRLPAGVWKDVADALGWSVDRLLGREDEADDGSSDAPVTSPIHGAAISFSREDFLRAYDKLTPPQTQLLARLMAALGFVHGVTVEVIPTWIPDEPDSGRPTNLTDGQAPAKRTAAAKRTQE